MKLRNKRGLIHLHVVIPIIAVLLVGIVGAWVWNSSKAATSLSLTDVEYRLRFCKNNGYTLKPLSAKSTNYNIVYCSVGVQNAINYWGKAGQLSTDGWYGSTSASYVKKYQTSCGLLADGIVGPITYAALHGYISYRIWPGVEPCVTSGSTPATSTSGWTKPIYGTYISQSYLTGVGYSVRGCPYAYKHCATDIATGGVSKPVYAVSGGTVIGRTVSQGSCGYATTGNCVIVSHSDGTKTVYNHVYPKVWSGTVAKGQQIGSLDLSGKTTGYHLHFMTVNSSGSVVDPVAFMKARGVTLP